MQADYDPLDKVLEEAGVAKNAGSAEAEELQINELLASAEQDTPYEKRKKGLVLLVILVLSLGILQLTRTFIYETHQVSGSSMQPTLSSEDRLLVSKFGKSWSSLFRKKFSPKRGDIIAIKDPQDEKTELVKRVLAVPGDRIVVKDGKITLYNQEKPDGFDLGEDFKQSSGQVSGQSDISLGEDQFFVVGDNRTGAYSRDSRTFGPISSEQIIGKVSFRIWPLSKLKKF